MDAVFCFINPKNFRDMIDTLVEQMKETEGITEQLKAENQLEWVFCIQNIEARARAVINRALISR